jgi:DNA end-binding protein Ku
MWKGVVSFGLVTVPVKAFPAVRDHDVHFHRIEKGTGARIRNRQVSEETGREVEADDIVMGFETGKGRHVTFDAAELDELRPESTRAVDVTDFVALDEIDPIYYQRTYWLAPDGEAAAKPYQLLRAAMEDRELAAIGTVVMRNKQYLTAIRPLEGALAMSTMRFADEVVARSEVDGVPDRRTKPDPKMLRMANQLVDSLTTDWDPRRYHDTFTEELRGRIEAKQAGKKLEIEPEEDAEPKVIDLMQALEESVKGAKATRRGRRKPRSRARKSA